VSSSSPDSRSLLVVGAHSADFVWRAAGAIAVWTAGGGSASVVALSYGERGESGELWKQPGQTVENVKRVRHEEASRAAAAVGASFECFDLGDWPLEVDRAGIDRLVSLIRSLRPAVILTHAPSDPFSADHGVAYAAVDKARRLAEGAGVSSAFEIVRPPELLCFEPHQPELCDFKPNLFVDITPVFERKLEAMSAMAAQSYLHTYYGQRAEHRGNHARRISGDQSIKQAEAFQRMLPVVVKGL
jgi:4-oxalomesaconate hydratase